MFRNNLLLRFSRKMHFPPYTDQQNLVERNVERPCQCKSQQQFHWSRWCVRRLGEGNSWVLFTRNEGTADLARPLATGMPNRVDLQQWHKYGVTYLRWPRYGPWVRQSNPNWMPEGNLSSPKCPDRSIQPLIKWTSPGIKRLASEADHSLPSSADVQSNRSHASTGPQEFTMCSFTVTL
jgi:hypothetical protein